MIEEKKFWKLMERIGKNLKKQRRDKTQETMARELGISVKYYQSLERGDKALSIRSLWKLSEKLQIPIEKLVEIA